MGQALGQATGMVPASECWVHLAVSLTAEGQSGGDRMVASARGLGEHWEDA